MAALPTSVLKQRTRLEEEIGMRTDGTIIEPTPATPAPELSVVPTTPVATQPTVSEPTVSPLEARIKELEHLLSTRDGQTSTAMREANEARQRADIQASQIRTLEETIGSLQRQTETAEARAAAKQADAALPSFDVEEPTSEQFQKFDIDSVDFINKLSKKQLVGYVKPLHDKIVAMEKQLERVRELDKLPGIEKAVAEAGTESERIREEDFFRKEVLAHFNDFESVRDTPAWKAYLYKDIPGRGIKIHHLLDSYRKVHNAQGIRSLIQGHYDELGAKPTLASLATPQGTRTEGTIPTKPRMKASEYKKNLRAFTSRQLSKEKWEAFKSDFNTALSEERVDMDERL